MKKIFIAIAAIALCLSFAACSAQQNVNDHNAAVSAADTAEVSSTGSTENSLTEAHDSSQRIRKIILSGSPEDVFTADTDCYAEGEKAVLYFGKGVNVRGDMLALTERVMDELSAITGLDYEYDGTGTEYTEFRNLGLENSSFEHINPGAEKVNIVLAYNPEKNGIQCAFESGALLDEYDYDMDETGYQTLYHELAHVIHLRNSADVGRTLCEGYAVYLSEIAMREAMLPVWSHIQHYMPVEFDESLIEKGADGFVCGFDDFETNYDYGFRLVMFLENVYGKNTFYRIADEAADRGFDSSYGDGDPQAEKDSDTKELVSIIIDSTSDDVFERFAQWNKTIWKDRVDEYVAYMESIGQIIG